MGPKIDLGPFLSDLRQKKDDGVTWNELAAWLQEEHGVVCDGRTIRRRLADTNADVTGFSIVNLDPYMDVIMQQREEDVPFIDILDYLMKQHNVRTSERTLQRRCQQWGSSQTHIHLQEEEEDAIREKLEIYITRDCHTDQEALRHLQKDGHHVTLWHVRRLRKNLGYRRWRHQAENQELQEYIEQVIRYGLDYAGLRSYGRNFVYTWLRRHRHLYAR
jgi:hypothetical protein